jgi:hypothetical protein
MMLWGPLDERDTQEMPKMEVCDQLKWLDYYFSSFLGLLLVNN